VQKNFKEAYQSYAAVTLGYVGLSTVLVSLLLKGRRDALPAASFLVPSLALLGILYKAYTPFRNMVRARQGLQEFRKGWFFSCPERDRRKAEEIYIISPIGHFTESSERHVPVVDDRGVRMEITYDLTQDGGPYIFMRELSWNDFQRTVTVRATPGLGEVRNFMVCALPNRPIKTVLPSYQGSTVPGQSSFALFLSLCSPRWLWKQWLYSPSVMLMPSADPVYGCVLPVTCSRKEKSYRCQYVWNAN
jgi:hypothetical protein